jgi:8-oxo-dGTP diphosphatase
VIYLLRHAKAGDRSRWTEGDDWLRPLTTDGHRQARALLDRFGHARFGRIVSSPYARCLETVVPLAGAHSIPIEPHDALAEGAALADTLKLIDSCQLGGAVLCTHGDVIPNVLGHLQAHEGLDLGPEPRCAKGSVWVLEGEPISRAIYWPAP